MLVEEAWKIQTKGTMMFQMQQKLKMLKRILRGLHKNNYTQISKSVSEAELKLLLC